MTREMQSTKMRWEVHGTVERGMVSCPFLLGVLDFGFERREESGGQTYHDVL